MIEIVIDIVLDGVVGITFDSVTNVDIDVSIDSVADTAVIILLIV